MTYKSKYRRDKWLERAETVAKAKEIVRAIEEKEKNERENKKHKELTC